jgi:predicted secreted acid phosphatase
LHQLKTQPPAHQHRVARQRRLARPQRRADQFIESVVPPDILPHREQLPPRCHPGERLAVVFDINETVLSNLPVIHAKDFDYNSREWGRLNQKAEAPALPAVKEVFLAAHAADVAVLFLYGREDPRDFAGTAKNLRREGMGDYAVLQLTPAKFKKVSNHDRKTAARAAWEAEGWAIIATIGDQESDLGPHAERSFKLPNPFYKVP